MGSARRNNIEEIPVDFVKKEWKKKNLYSNLEVLDLADNLFVRLPEALGKFPNIKVLDFSSNQVDDFPAALDNLTIKGVEVRVPDQEFQKTRRDPPVEIEAAATDAN